MMQSSLAEKLRLLRAQRGLTVRDAAQKIGVDRHTLHRLEGGVGEPRYPTLHKIAKGYGVPIEDLLIEEEPALAGKAEAPEAGPVQSDAPQLPDYLLSMTPAEVKAYGEELSTEELEELRKVFDEHWKYWHAVLNTEKEAGRDQSDPARQAYRQLNRNTTPAMILKYLLDIQRGKVAQRELEALVG